MYDIRFVNRPMQEATELIGGPSVSRIIKVLQRKKVFDVITVDGKLILVEANGQWEDVPCVDEPIEEQKLDANVGNYKHGTN